MADPRFYRRRGPLTIADAAALCGASDTRGDLDVPITGVAAIGESAPGHVSYIEDAALIEGGVSIPDRCVIIARPDVAEALSGMGASVIVHARPRAVFARIAREILSERDFHSGESVSPEARIGKGVHIAPGAVIGPDADIGENCRIGPGAAIGPGVVLGPNSSVGANAVVTFTIAGESVQIGACSVIGGAGFGVVIAPGETVDIPHFGRVLLGDGVTIGANCGFDRGVFGDTVIGDRCKFDNLIHIAHNVTIGEDSVFAGFSAVSGSVRIGRNVVFGGRAGCADHVVIGDGARIGGDSGVMRDVPAGETHAGTPAVPLRTHFRQVAALRRLAEPRKKG